MRAHIDKTSEALERFIVIGEQFLRILCIKKLKSFSEGIPCISFAQKRSSRMLLNASTVATFFAGVAGK